MSKPNFQKGTQINQVQPARDGTWYAKYDGECDHCGAKITALVTRVKWNDDSTAVVCGHHRTQPAPEWTF